MVFALRSIPGFYRENLSEVSGFLGMSQDFDFRILVGEVLPSPRRSVVSLNFIIVGDFGLRLTFIVFLLTC